MLSVLESFLGLLGVLLTSALNLKYHLLRQLWDPEFSWHWFSSVGSSGQLIRRKSCSKCFIKLHGIEFCDRTWRSLAWLWVSSLIFQILLRGLFKRRMDEWTRGTGNPINTNAAVAVKHALLFCSKTHMHLHTVQHAFKEAVSRWVVIAALPWRSLVHPHAIFSFLYFSKGQLPFHRPSISLFPFPPSYFSSSSLSR